MKQENSVAKLGISAVYGGEEVKSFNVPLATVLQAALQSCRLTLLK